MIQQKEQGTIGPRGARRQRNREHLDQGGQGQRNRVQLDRGGQGGKRAKFTAHFHGKLLTTTNFLTNFEGLYRREKRRNQRG